MVLRSIGRALRMTMQGPARKCACGRAVQPAPDAADPAPTDEGSDTNRRQPTPTDSNGADPRRPTAVVGSRVVSVSAPVSAPTREARPARDHAAALLEWLQGADGRTGSLFADELDEMHREMCVERDWELVGWTAVARELRRLLSARKEYAWRDGKRVRVYRIPPARPSAMEAPRQRAGAHRMRVVG